jgi:predicted RNA-binding Zn-ribbon protein involved in translation (DUF1610 family)
VSDDRKYRHRGYMDSGGEAPRGPRGRAAEGAPTRSEGAPRGRSAGFEKDLVVQCKACGQRVPGLENLDPGAACPKCGGALHACVQCRHFDSSARWECSRNAEIPARIPVKTAGNACPLFSPLAGFDMTGTRTSETPGDARRAFDALFKK